MIFINANLAKPASRAGTLFLVFGALSWVCPISHAANLPSTDGYTFVTPVAPTGWQFRVTPYAWAPSVNGDVTVRGRTADIDFSFWDLFDSGSSGVERQSENWRGALHRTFATANVDAEQNRASGRTPPVRTLWSCSGCHGACRRQFFPTLPSS